MKGGLGMLLIGDKYQFGLFLYMRNIEYLWV